MSSDPMACGNVLRKKLTGNSRHLSLFLCSWREMSVSYGPGWWRSSRESEMFKAVCRGPRTHQATTEKEEVDGGEAGREVGAMADPPPPTCKSKTGVTIGSLHLEPGFCPAELPAVLECASTLHTTTFCSSMLCPISFFIGRKCSLFPRKMMAAGS